MSKKLLEQFVGVWRGRGMGVFPTITTFEYIETLRFELDGERPILHYEQRTHRRNHPSEAWVASHWESGFIMVLENGQVEICNAQSGGRTEVLVGAFSAEGRVLSLTSKQLSNDARMRATTRRIEIDGDQLNYAMEMETTAVASLQGHLSAELQRVSNSPQRDENLYGDLASRHSPEYNQL